MEYSKYHVHVRQSKADYQIKVDENWGTYFFSLIDYLNPSHDVDGIVFGHLVVDANGVLSRARRVKGYTGDGYWCLSDVNASNQAKNEANKLALSDKGLPIITGYDDTHRQEKMYLRGINGEDIVFKVYITSFLSRNYLKKQLEKLIIKK